MRIIFKKGIPGLENITEFEIKDLKGNDKFKILQSTQEPSISLVSTSPFEIYNDYEIKLSDDVIEELKIKEITDVLVLNIITLGKTIESSTMNLKAPVIINLKTQLGKQIILQTDKYKTKHPLIRR